MKDDRVHPFFLIDGCEIPNTFANRAVWSLWALKRNPENAQVDAEGLVWMEHDLDGLWYSIAGNYSGYSPHEKIAIAARYEKEQQKQIEKAEDYYSRVLYQSGIRKKVLERDDYTCQICGKYADTKLHVHHVLKRREGGTDHLDNLLTACPSCHHKADRSLYNPEWVEV